MTNEELHKFLCDTALALNEHFDSVQIVATSYDHEGTGYFSAGCGNWWARRGSCESFLERGTHEDAARWIANEIKAKEDDED